MELDIRSKGELFAKLQQVTLRGGNAQPYLNARIDLVTLDPNILAPTQRYVITDELKKIEQLRWEILKEHNRDILGLDGYVKCHYPATKEQRQSYEVGGEPYSVEFGIRAETTIDIIPPVVEEWFSEQGKLHLIIADGQHRCFLARQMQRPITVVYVRGIHWGYPYYAYPLPRGWEDVEIRDDIPTDYIKKFHSVQEHKKLFRNYNSKFENIGTSRPRTRLVMENVLAPPPTEEEKNSKLIQENLISDVTELVRAKRANEDRLRQELNEAGRNAHSPLSDRTERLQPLDNVMVDYGAGERVLREIRARAGVDYEQSLEALKASSGNLEKAIDYLRKKGWSKD